jgi:hypothetical protein
MAGFLKNRPVFRKTGRFSNSKTGRFFRKPVGFFRKPVGFLENGPVFQFDFSLSRAGASLASVDLLALALRLRSGSMRG